MTIEGEIATLKAQFPRHTPGEKLVLKKKALKLGLDLNLNKLIVPGAVMLAFMTLGIVGWRSSGEFMA